MFAKTFRQLKRLIIAVVGFTVLAIGIMLIVTPGPAIVVIPAGLAILSIEFAWARNLLKKMKDKLHRGSESDSKSGDHTLQR
jgi:uncharacterized protein (TIGR02611 family)